MVSLEPEMPFLISEEVTGLRLALVGMGDLKTPVS